MGCRCREEVKLIENYIDEDKNLMNRELKVWEKLVLLMIKIIVWLITLPLFFILGGVMIVISLYNIIFDKGISKDLGIVNFLLEKVRKLRG